MILEQLRSLNLARMDLDSLVELHTAGNAILTSYKTFEVPVPSFLVDSLASIATDIRSRRADAQKARLKEIAARKTHLRTREQERADLESEEASLRTQLGMDSASKPASAA